MFDRLKWINLRCHSIISEPFILLYIFRNRDQQNLMKILRKKSPTHFFTSFLFRPKNVVQITLRLTRTRVLTKMMPFSMVTQYVEANRFQFTVTSSTSLWPCICACERFFILVLHVTQYTSVRKKTRTKGILLLLFHSRSLSLNSFAMPCACVRVCNRAFHAINEHISKLKSSTSIVDAHYFQPKI